MVKPAIEGLFLLLIIWALTKGSVIEEYLPSIFLVLFVVLFLVGIIYAIIKDTVSFFRGKTEKTKKHGEAETKIVFPSHWKS